MCCEWASGRGLVSRAGAVGQRGEVLEGSDGLDIPAFGKQRWLRRGGAGGACKWVQPVLYL